MPSQRQILRECFLATGFVLSIKGLFKTRKVRSCRNLFHSKLSFKELSRISLRDRKKQFTFPRCCTIFR